jgi:hypothetical protein
MGMVGHWKRWGVSCMEEEHRGQFGDELVVGFILCLYEYRKGYFPVCS